jgi:hypothetical protein
MMAERPIRMSSAEEGEEEGGGVFLGTRLL